MSDESRIDSEWVALNAVREVLKIATKGDMRKSTYDAAMELGGAIYPELLGPEISVLRRQRESDTVKEYRQRARLKSIKDSISVSPLDLLVTDVTEIEDLLQIAAQEKSRERVDQLKRKRALLKGAIEDLSPLAHTENQLIFRDAYNVERDLPSLSSGKSYKGYQLPSGNVLRIRVLHPDKPEHVTGADVIYERHNPYKEEASVVAVQYKIWDEKVMLLTDSRMKRQLKRLKDFTCDNSLCDSPKGDTSYRFPYCAAFLRPTDKLQRPDQKLISSGEHLPICLINACKTQTDRGTDCLKLDSLSKSSLSGEVFEYLFNAGRIGSRMIPYGELAVLYKQYEIAASKDHVVIHAQELNDAWD